MKNAILGAVVGIVIAVFGTLFYVQAVQSLGIMNSRVTAIEQFLNQQIKAAQQVKTPPMVNPDESKNR